MDKLLIRGGARLSGTVRVSGAKNSALPLMACALLGEGKSVLTNVPALADVRTMSRLLQNMGCEVSFANGTVEIDASKVAVFEAPYDLVKTMRASVVVLGPLVGRFGRARISLPGGCAIGARPIDQHLKVLEALGASITVEHGYVIAEAKRLKGATFTFDIQTVTGTENALMAAACASGTTTLLNCAQEPEVVELAEVLVSMGARIEGAGTERITVEGLAGLRPYNRRVMPDRIETGTLIAAAAITGGDVTIEDAVAEHSSALIAKLAACGVSVESVGRNLRVRVPGGTGSLKSADIETQPFPGFATDMQAQYMALMTVTQETSIISENVFENRFMHVQELVRMGADIRIKGNVAVVKGVPKLTSAPVMATDLRASAGLVVAALVAEGETVVDRIYHLDRGYESLEKKLADLGAMIERFAGRWPEPVLRKA